MNISCAYGVAGSYGSYGTGKAPSANKKVSTAGFEVPTSEFANEKATTPKSENSTVADPLKNMAKTDPGFSFILHTKTEPTRSDEEILKELEELAKENAGTQYHHNNKRFWELMDEYISSVSPDRKSILESGALDNGYGETLGSVIGYNSKGQLVQSITKEEAVRSAEAYALYDAVYDFVCGGERRLDGMRNPSETYKETYNKAYERLTSGAVA